MIPLITYDTDTELALTLPLPAFAMRSVGIGSADVAGSGIGAALQVRRDYLCEIRLQFFESEWGAVEAWLDWAQRLQAFDFRFDATDALTEKSVYLHEPLLTEGGFEPVRTQYVGVYEQRIVLRTVAGTPFGVAWTDE